MSCPTCSHTMNALGYFDGGTAYYCPRCGTMRHANQFTDAPPEVYVPKLVERCRAFEGGLIRPPRAVHMMEEVWGGLRTMWKAIGIAESINKPEDRE